MALETGTFISDLVSTNPVATDGLAQSDDHMRLIKSTIKASFPGVTGAINATHTEINTVADGDTAATSTTLVDADRIPVNDDGTMVQVAMSDFKTYMNSNITTIGGLTYPTADGNAGEFMTTDGAGTLSFAPVVSFISGMILPYAGTSAPTGWLLCDGSAVPSATYGDLYAVISNTYGGDATNFNLPDLRGRTIAGKDDMGGTSADRLTNQSGGLDGDTLGATGGAETHQLTTAELAAHTHDGTFCNASVGTNFASVHGAVANANGTKTASDSTGGDTAHNNVQPTIILNYIIKT